MSSKYWKFVIIFGVLYALLLLVYLPGLSGPLKLDSSKILPKIKFDDEAIKYYLTHVRSRGVGELSYMFNLRIFGESNAKLRVINILIHFLNAAIILLILNIILKSRSISTQVPYIHEIKYFIVLIWLFHPIHYSVNLYVIQRYESLASCFYLLGIYAFLRMSIKASYIYMLLFTVSMVLGLLTKLIVVTLPVAAYLLSRLLVARSPMWYLRKYRYAFIILVPITSLIIGKLTNWGRLFFETSETATVGFNVLSSTDYFIFQSKAIWFYIRDLVAPFFFVFDPMWLNDEKSVAVYSIFLITMAALICLAWRAYSRDFWATMLFIAYIIIAPTSSIVPVQDLFFHHRIYLASFFVLFALLIYICKFIFTNKKYTKCFVLLMLGLLVYSLYISIQAIVFTSLNTPTLLTNLIVISAGIVISLIFFKVTLVKQIFFNQQKLRILGLLFLVFFLAFLTARRSAQFANVPYMAQESINANPCNVRALLVMGKYELDRGNKEAAFKYIVENIHCTQHVAMDIQFVQTAKLLKRLGRTDYAIKVLEEGAAQMPQWYRLNFQLLNYYMSYSDYASVNRTASVLLKDHMDKKDMIYFKLLALLRLKRYTEGMAFVETNLKALGADDRLLTFRTIFKYLAGAGSAPKLTKDMSFESYYILSYAYLYAGNLPQALKAVNACLEFHAGYRDGMLLKARILIQLNQDIEEARRIIETVIRSDEEPMLDSLSVMALYWKIKRNEASVQKLAQFINTLILERKQQLILNINTMEIEPAA